MGLNEIQKKWNAEQWEAYEKIRAEQEDYINDLNENPQNYCCDCGCKFGIDCKQSKEDSTYCEECYDESMRCSGHYSERMSERFRDMADDAYDRYKESF